jgi:NAD(P)-dependent dehydrogenase (short-subunit alcohol dehydrogenase family)
MNGLRCLVTGSTCGIGEAIARLFLAEGACVLVTGLDGSLAWDAEECGARSPVVYADLAQPDAPQRLLHAALERFGGLDVLVNNAASTARFNAAQTTAEVFDRMMAVNVRAPFLLCREAFEPLRRSGGCVLNIGSINGYCGEEDLLPYSISKGALHTLSRNLADAWGRHEIRVNHFVLGWVLTRNEYELKLRDGMPPDWHRNPPAHAVPFGTMTTPETIARAALYWCCKESWPLSGNTIELEQFPLIGRNPPKRG